MRELLAAVVVVAVAGCAPAPRSSMGAPEDAARTIDQENPEIDHRRRGVTAVGESQPVDYQEYLRLKREGRVTKEERRGGYVYFAVTEMRHAPIPPAGPDAATGAHIEVAKGHRAMAPKVRPADEVMVGGRDILKILKMLGARRDAGATDKQLVSYSRHFDRSDADRDGRHSKKEYIEDGSFMTPRARRGIFGAADNNADGVVTRVEYVLNRIITDEAKFIVQRTDADKNGRIVKAEFVSGSPLEDKRLAAAVFDALDTNGDGMITIPEYLRVWGGWARPDYKAQEARVAARLAKLGKGGKGIGPPRR